MVSKNIDSPKKTKKPKKVCKPKKVEHKSFTVDDIVYFELKGRAAKEHILAFVSINKWPCVSKYAWYLDKNGYPFCYDIGMHLHRFVYTLSFRQKIPSKLYVDHIDRNKLNNTDLNLRLATAQENAFNKTTTNNKKGVRKISDGNYIASITKDGVRREIKNIATEQEAAHIYNMMAEELFGCFAALNIIDDRYKHHDNSDSDSETESDSETDSDSDSHTNKVHYVDNKHYIDLDHCDSNSN